MARVLIVTFLVLLALAACATSNVPLQLLQPTPTPPTFGGPRAFLSVSPTNVQIYAAGAANAQTILVQETSYIGAFSETDNCNPSTGRIATISPSSGDGPSFTFTATGVAAGTCSATFSDSNLQQVAASLTVTTSGIGINAEHAGRNRGP